MTEFINESANEFVDISTEQFRTYAFPNGDEVTITNPLRLAVSASGHRLFDAQGVSHYVPKGWFHLMWKSRDGKAHFVK